MQIREFQREWASKNLWMREGLGMAVQPSHSGSTQLIERFSVCWITQLTIFSFKIHFSFGSSNIYLTLSANYSLLFHKYSIYCLKESPSHGIRQFQIPRTKTPDFKTTSPRQTKWLLDSQHEWHSLECFCFFMVMESQDVLR